MPDTPQLIPQQAGPQQAAPQGPPDYAGFIHNARAAGYSDADLADKMLASGWKREDVSKLLGATTPQSAGGNAPDPGFFGEMGKQWVDPLVSMAKSLPDRAQRYLNPGAGGLPGEIGKDLWSMISGVAKDSGHEIQQGFQQMRQGGGSNIMDGLTRAGVGAVPFVGPVLNSGVDHARAGHYGAAGADFLTSLAQVLSPEDLVKGASGVAEKLGIHSLGRTTASKALGFTDKQRVPPRSELEALARDTHALPTPDTTSKFRTAISEQMDIAKNELQKYGNTDIQSQDALKQIADDFAHEVNTGDKSSATAAALLKKYEDFIDTFGNKVSLQKAQELKQETWKKLGDSDFQKEAAQQPGLKKAYMSRGIGLKNAIEDVVGGPTSPLAQANRKAHLHAALLSQLQDIAEKQPAALQKWAPYIMSSTVMGGLGALGLGAPGLHAMAGPATAVGLAGLMAHGAMHNPQSMMRLGYFLNEVGRGRGSQLASYVPRASALAHAANDQEANPAASR